MAAKMENMYSNIESLRDKVKNGHVFENVMFSSPFCLSMVSQV